MRDPRRTGHRVVVLTPEEEEGVRMFMKIQMERERQQVISKRAAEEAREAKFRALEESHREALKKLEAAEAEKKEQLEKTKKALAAMKEEELRKLDEEIMRRRREKDLERMRQERVNAEMRELSAQKAAKMAIPVHPEFKKMSYKCQQFVLKLKNKPCEVLEKLNAGDAFRLKMEEECRVVC